MLINKTLKQLQLREQLKTEPQKNHNLIEKLCGCIELLIFGLANYPIPERFSFSKEGKS